MPYPQYTPDEVAQRGEAMYERQIRARVEPEHQGQFVVIDIETGDYELDVDDLAATKRALAKRPCCALWTTHRLPGGVPPWRWCDGASAMITGRVTAQRDATVRLVVLDSTHQPHDVDAVIDTGFNGFLTLPCAMAQTLQLPWRAIAG